MKYVALTLVLLTLVFLLVLGSFKPADIFMGVVVAGVLIYGTRRLSFRNKPTSQNLFSRFIHFWPFLVAEIWIIVNGTLEVALITLHIRPLASPGIVAVPIGERTPTGVAVSAQCTTLSPGTFLVDVDWERGVMLLHAIDATDPDEVRREHQEFYDRWQRKVFP
ncbi:MAG: Na+/H+ antiporter subunit E [Rubrobacteraceae bacterium]